MAEGKKKSGSASASNGTVKPRGPRKPTEYRFETIDETGKVESLNLVITHQDSAKIMKDFLNELAESNGFNYKYRFTKVIVFQ